MYVCELVSQLHANYLTEKRNTIQIHIISKLIKFFVCSSSFAANSAFHSELHHSTLDNFRFFNLKSRRKCGAYCSSARKGSYSYGVCTSYVWEIFGINQPVYKCVYNFIFMSERLFYLIQMFSEAVFCFRFLDAVVAQSWYTQLNFVDICCGYTLWLPSFQISTKNFI